MRWRLVVGVVIFFSLVEVVLGAGLLSPTLFSGRDSANGAAMVTAQSGPASGNAIVRENALAGSSSWKIPAGQQATIQIQAYASATSVLPGKTLTFYVSTQQNGMQYWLDIYRLGWYGGDGGRLILSVGAQVGHAQGYYNDATHQLVGCISCVIDKHTGLIEANWQSSYALPIPTTWTTGIYLAKFTGTDNMQTYVPFDVLGNFPSEYVVVTPDTTYEAYNNWGGSSLYGTDNGMFNESENGQKAVKVSFDRPYVQEAGSSQVLVFEVDAIRWMERQGYDLSYISNLDLDRDPGQLLRHKAYISLGHDEYWTKAMRDGMRDARDSGVGLAFLGANAAYWQMRFEPDSRGVAYRTVVCYKVSTSEHNLALDPAYPKDITHVTARWRDPVLGRPENALVGVMYSDLTQKHLGFPWRVSTSTGSFLLMGTGLQAGQHYGCGLVGYEWDRVFANGATPKGLQIISTSSTVNDSNVPDQGNTTYYIAPSGAMVFATGSIYWTSALDSYRLHTDAECIGQELVVPGIQRLMANVMKALAVHHTLPS
jgi:hypothetical protein